MSIWEDVQAALGVELFPFGEFRSGKVDPLTLAGLGWPSVNRIIKYSNFEPGTIKVVPETDLDPGLYIEAKMGGGTIIERQPRNKPFTELLRDGATLVLNKADRAIPELSDFVERLMYAQNEAAWANGYACWSKNSPFGRHSDSHDTIIVQTEGRKHWRVYRGSGSDAELVFDKILEVGDFIHVPVGWDHEVTGVGCESLHWTFGVAHTSQTEAINELISYGWSLGQIDRLSEESLRCRLLHLRGELSTEHRKGLSLPWRVHDSSFSGAVLRWAGRFKPSLEINEGQLHVRGLGKLVKLPLTMRPVLEVLISGGSLPFDSLSNSAREVVLSMFNAELLIAEHADQK
ncbi:JmjC domain-containing protein [Glutamicibacter ardleyensis]|uniref:JmjC domain-containing protein n=1 Tax=Glutamicibacter ardleyensis TaxID=225894 RepID=UPI003FD4ABC2